MGTGQQAALAAAACWATASLLYGKIRLSALGMNLGKNVLATAILFVQLLVLASYQSESQTLLSADLFSGDTNSGMWLALSGVIGIVVGDTFYFRSLQILGPRKALIISTTAPVFAAAFGFVFLGEVLDAVIITGVLLTTGGVMFVIADRKSANESPGLFPGSTQVGVMAALAAAVCQALGAVCSKIGMEHCDPVEAAFIRLFTAAVGVLAIVAFSGHLQDVCKRLYDKKLLQTFVPAVVLGTWLGIWLSQVAFKFTTVSIATTLQATTPLFIVPLVWLFNGHRISLRAVVGTLIAVAGVILVVN